MLMADLIRRNLRHHWKTNAAVAGGLAIATATFTGSGIIGDSVQRSLRDLAFARLGHVEGALKGATPFTAALAQRIHPGAAPALSFEGVVRHAATERARDRVLVYGVDERYWKLQEIANPLLGDSDAVLSDALAQDLGAEKNQQVVLLLDRPSDLPREVMQARRDQPPVAMRLRVSATLPDRELGGFSLAPRQGRVRALFVKLSVLQRELSLLQRVNLILFPEEIRSDIQVLGHLRLEDVGLRLRTVPGCGCSQLDSVWGTLRDDQVGRALRTVQEQGLRAEPYMIYPVNAITAHGAVTPHAMVIAKPGVPEGSIVLNEWVAWDMAVLLDEKIRLSFYTWNPESGMVSGSTSLQLKSVQPIGMLADRFVVPDYPGISDARSLKAWNPTFPMDRSKIRPIDEMYWTTHRATPKAMMNLGDAQKLWGTRFGKVTGIRIWGKQPLNLAPSVDLDRDGLSLLPLRQRMEQAAEGSTDFGELFFRMSFFLMSAALLLTWALFRLSLEYRMKEIGLYRILGFSSGDMRKLFLREALFLGVAAALGGALLGVAFSALLMQGLRTWWADAVGDTGFSLYLSVRAITGGMIPGLALSLAVVLLSLGRLRKLSPRQMFTGERREEIRTNSPKVRSLALAAVACGLLLLGAASSRLISPDHGFFIAGLILLTGTILYLYVWLDQPRPFPIRTVAELCVAGAARRPGRGVLIILLIGLPLFLLIALEAFRYDSEEIDVARAAGTGGYGLIAEPQWPIYRNPAAEERLRGVNVVPLRARPGEDASILNLYQPLRPRIAAVPDVIRSENRFRFSSGGWQLLDVDLPNGAVAAIVDANTMQKVLHKQLGDVVEVPGSSDTLRFQIVGTLSDSIFRSELLISERNFLRLFPSEQGYRMLLVDAPREQWAATGSLLQEALPAAKLRVMTASERLQQFQRVENAQLSIFQAIGALGLLIGTLGMAAALEYGVLERGREIAILRAYGYSKADVRRVVFTEYALLLGAGLASGTVCALLAVGPALAQRSQSVSPMSLFLLLAAMLAIGLGSLWLAAGRAAGPRLGDALRAE